VNLPNMRPMNATRIPFDLWRTTMSPHAELQRFQTARASEKQRSISVFDEQLMTFAMQRHVRSGRSDKGTVVHQQRIQHSKAGWGIIGVHSGWLDDNEKGRDQQRLAMALVHHIQRSLFLAGKRRRPMYLTRTAYQFTNTSDSPG